MGEVGGGCWVNVEGGCCCRRWVGVVAVNVEGGCCCCSEVGGIAEEGYLSGWIDLLYSRTLCVEQQQQQQQGGASVFADKAHCAQHLAAHSCNLQLNKGWCCKRIPVLALAGSLK